MSGRCRRLANREESEGTRIVRRRKSWVLQLMGLPVSTTHSLTGALVGAGLAGAGFSHVRFAALGNSIVLPLLFSPIAALL